MLTELLFLGLSLVAASEGKNWALVVAGSNGWYNYRHQVLCFVSLRFLILVAGRKETPPLQCTTQAFKYSFKVILTSFNLLPSLKQFAIVC